ncbi:MAG: CrcB family protein [Alphaproteobacteria bacterium]|nr:CrcB family protein [Alphaproteobacteria bacterium]
MTGPDGRFMVASDMRIFVMVGLCGGYTTFSSFSLQTLNLAREGAIISAGLNILLSVLLCLISVWLGYLLASVFNQLKGA